MSRVIIAGSREIDGQEVTDASLVETAMMIAEAKGIIPSEIVCGMARGVDLLGKAWAEKRGIPVKEIPAQWENPDGTKNRGAGFQRNRAMAKYADAAVLVFDGQSRGTANMIEEAHKAGLQVYVHHVGESGQNPDISGHEAEQSVADAPAQKPAEPAPHPKTVNTTRRVGETLYVAGEGPRREDGKPAQSDIMFITTSLLEEEAEERQELTVSGHYLPSKPRYLKSAAGTILKDLLLGVGIDMKECFYTAVCKWLLPRATRLKPKKEDLNRALPALLAEIEAVQPKIIICLGKPAFDVLDPSVGDFKNIKITFNDAKGGWFTSDKAPGAKIYVLEDPTKLVTKAEYVEKFRADFLEVSRLREELRGNVPEQIPLDYRTISTFAELVDWLDEMERGQFKLFSVDCEWAGHNHVDGTLRSIQFCWKPGSAVYIRFTAPTADGESWEYVFDVPYEVAGAALAGYMNRPDVFYVGHHIAADFPWMHYVLGLDYWDKCVLDTEFALQCVNEHESHGLERIALLYTPFGRYDLPLIVWKKQNPGKITHENGYGLVPDDLIIPYGCMDVDAPMRAHESLVKALKEEGMWEYWTEIFCPFISSCFTDMTLQGLIIDRQKLDELRELYNWATEELTREFQKLVCEEAGQLLFSYLVETAGENIGEAIAIHEAAMAGEREGIWERIKALVGVHGVKKAQDVWEHFVDSPNFNIRSSPQMRRWLFDVKGLTPVKSTGNKEKGIPSVSWEKVLTYPEAKQKEFTPSVDAKQTLQILGEQDALVSTLLDLNAIGNVRKGFLKPADLIYDEATGQMVQAKENGLHSWIASDGKVHGQFSATETGRPRAWNPNSLNWPSWVNKKIENGIAGLLKSRHEQGLLPPQFERYITEKIPSIRSVVIAGEGHVFCEDDYVTAELVAWAVISGDKNMIRLLTEPDKEFGFVMVPGEDDPYPVRLFWGENSPVAEEWQKPEFLMAAWKEGDKIIEATEAQLLRNEDGTIKHPCPCDLHWGLAEMVTHKPREVLLKKKERDGIGKVGNFKSAYGATADTMERSIEADTGIKPEPGTGQALLEALEKRQPQAILFMLNQETLPENPGYLRTASGRVRHFVKDKFFLASLDPRSRRSLLSRLSREARNYPPQESVGATAARAFVRMQRYLRNNGFEARVSICLYDSLVVRAPLHERFIIQQLQKRFMSTDNTWQYDDRVLQYQTDQELNFAWSSPPKGEIKKLVYDRNWKV